MEAELRRKLVPVRNRAIVLVRIAVELIAGRMLSTTGSRPRNR
jgi:hypothetical protein